MNEKVNLYEIDNTDTDLKKKKKLFVSNLTNKNVSDDSYGVVQCGYIIAGAFFPDTAIPRILFDLIAIDTPEWGTVVDWQEVKFIIDRDYSSNLDSEGEKTPEQVNLF